VEELYCNNCGHRNPEGANFCSSFGAVLEGPGEDVTITFFPTEPTDPTEPATAPTTDGGTEAGDPLEPLHLQVGSAALVARRGPAAGSRYLLDEEVTTLGRHPDSAIFLDDVTVSRRHAEVIRTDDGYEVRDLGSLNGTYLNRNRIERVPLTNGDELQVGSFKLTFFSAEEDEE
jgi:pSer/pThr/pTyr-binding forkhead associated (FHA) protein